MISKKAWILSISIFTYISLNSCSSWFHSYQNPQTIAELNHKRKGKTVYLAGEVIRTIPLVKNGAYQLQDDTGKIWILTNVQLPVQGAKISVKGKIQYQELPFAKEELYLQEINTQAKK